MFFKLEQRGWVVDEYVGVQYVGYACLVSSEIPGVA